MSNMSPAVRGTRLSESARPRRVQRRRTAGWKMPPGAVHVGRGSMWGNPFRIGEPRGGLPPRTAEQAVFEFEQWLTTDVSQPRYGVQRARILTNLHQLRGKDLACWCKLTAPCHADVLMSLANPSNGAS